MRYRSLVVLASLLAGSAGAAQYDFAGWLGPYYGPAAFDRAADVAVAADGSLWIADEGTGRVLHIGPTGGGQLLGELTPIPPQWHPTGVAILADGRFAVAAGNVSLFESDGSGATTLSIGGRAYDVEATSGGGFLMSQEDTYGLLSWPGMESWALTGTRPTGLGIGTGGWVYYADTHGGSIRALHLGSTDVRIVVGLSSPLGVEVHDGLVYVVEYGGHRVRIFDSALRLEVGRFGSFGGGPGQLYGPTGIGFGPDGTAFVSEAGNRRISMFRPAPTPAIAVSWGRIKQLYR